MRAAANLMIHPSRLEQLKQLANHWNLTLAETVERWICQEIEAGVIPDETPGIVIEPAEDRLRVTVRDLAPIFVRWEEVQKLGEHFTYLPAAGERMGGWKLPLKDGGSWGVARVGRAIVHIVTDADGKVAKLIMTDRMVRDLDRQLDAATRGIMDGAIALLVAESDDEAAAA